MAHDGNRIFNAYTAESTANFLSHNWLWTRIENVDRSLEEDPVGRVQGYTFGYERDLPVGISSLTVGLGAQVTTYGLPQQLKSVYGDRPAGFSVFLRIRPTGNVAQHMQMMHQQH